MTVNYLFDESLVFGVPTLVAAGMWWVRLPIDMALDHVNLYLLEDHDGLVLVDTGCNDDHCRSMLQQVLQQPPFVNRRLSRIIATHYHPDHFGQVGYLTKSTVSNQRQELHQDAPVLLTSRTCWQTASLLHGDQPQTPHLEHIQFMQRAGLSALELESFRRRKPRWFGDRVDQPPRSYQRLREQQELHIGDRCWTVRMGYGHANEHVTLWSDDGLAIVGDQLLPAVSPNLSVHFSEPDADCVTPWLTSCKDFFQSSDDNVQCFPGHQRPFVGLPTRCSQLIENTQQVLVRITEVLSRAKTAVELMPEIYRRPLSQHERNLLIGETMGYLNHLCQTGRLSRRLNSSGAFVWRSNKVIAPKFNLSQATK